MSIPDMLHFPVLLLYLIMRSRFQVKHATHLSSPHSIKLKPFLSELMDLFVAGRDQSAADQPNNLAEGHPPL